MTRLVFRPQPRSIVHLPVALLLLACALPLAAQPPLQEHKVPLAVPQTTPATPPPPPPAPVAPPAFVVPPGPIRSLLRMAGLSQKARTEEVLPLLARRVYQDGFPRGNQSEYLKLLRHYIQQARELQALAGQQRVLQVSGCADSAKLLGILGYRLSRPCGDKDATLQTEDAGRAFLTLDSGFPIVDLEEALQKDAPFSYPYASDPLPVLYQPIDWLKLAAAQGLRASDLIDALTVDSQVSRLYWALSQMDPETADYLQRSIGLRRLLPAATLLDFYGNQISIRSGHVLVPGGKDAEPAWTSLVGANPENPAQFVAHLFNKDDGWLAAYFDVLSRLDPDQQRRLTQTSRLKPYYEAFRPNEKKSAAAGSYRKAAGLLVLDTRLAWDSDGNPQVPGGLGIWNKILDERARSRAVRGFMHRVPPITQPDQLIEALGAASQEDTDSGPLQLYLTLCELDRRRAPGNKLTPETVSFLSSKYGNFHSWVLTFSEFPALTDASIVRFINIAESLPHIHNEALQTNALGAFQANVGLWQILARQHQIPAAELNNSWQQTIEPFASISSSTQLLDASRHSLRVMIKVAGGDPNGSPDQMLDLLAGPPQTDPSAQAIHERLRARIASVLEDQRLSSLDTLSKLADGLQAMEQGGKSSDALLELAAELHGFELPRALLTSTEKITYAPTVYMGRHAELQAHTDLTKLLKSPATPAQLEAARGQLAAFFRDTLVGLNYAYYEPPGAQIMHINPLFVRAHDFRSISILGMSSLWESPRMVGAGVAAGGGGFLIGSLADLPFSLADAEQDFIVPENVQSLIWKEVVPDLLTAATLPRWWDVTPTELHAIALYQRCGEEILNAAPGNPELRTKVAAILGPHMSPRRFDELQHALANKAALTALLPRIMPTDSFYLAEQFLLHSPDQVAASGPAGKELAALSAHSPEQAVPSDLSVRFGVPHPTLASSNAPEILNLSPFPASAGYTNRVFGETLEWPNLYWARLADELGYSPVMLHVLVPELTRIMAAKIFASEMEDFPAVLRAMRETGDDLRQGKIVALRQASITYSLAPAPDLRQDQQVTQ